MYEVRPKKKITMCFTADSNQGSKWAERLYHTEYMKESYNQYYQLFEYDV